MDSLRKHTPSNVGIPKKISSFPESEQFSPPPPPIYARRTERKRKIGWIRSLVTFFGAVVFLFFCFFGFLIYKGFSTGQNMQFVNKNDSTFLSNLKGITSSLLSENRKPLDGETEGRINILLLGRAGEHYPGKNLTDTVMLLSIDTEAKKVALLSLPRDLYVPIHETALYTKLNSLYQYGLSGGEDIRPISETIQDITGQEIHYFFIVDFDSFESVIDTLGGIQVDVVRDFYDTRYPGKNYSYETFEIKKGWQMLDGKTALKYVRERHNDPEGDFGRAKRQQQVLQAVKDKAFSVETFLNVFTLNTLLDTFGENVKTNMSVEDIGSLIELSRTLDTKNVTTFVVDAWKKESLLRVSHVVLGSTNAFILLPRVGNFSEIKEVSEKIFHLNELNDRRERIQSENPTLTVFYGSEDAFIVGGIKDLLLQLGFEKAVFLPLPTLEVSPERSTIIDRSALSKPFSLDELMGKFSLEKTDSFPYTLTQPIESDFIMVIGNDLSTALSLEETGTTVSDEPVYSEELPPQPKQQKKKR